MYIRFTLLVITCLLSSCLSYDFSRRVVQQGNLLAPRSLQKVHLGMSKEDVAITLGTSLISPLFCQDRWDYAYTWRKGNGPLLLRHVSLYFKNNHLTKIV